MSCTQAVHPILPLSDSCRVTVQYITPRFFYLQGYVLQKYTPLAILPPRLASCTKQTKQLTNNPCSSSFDPEPGTSATVDERTLREPAAVTSYRSRLTRGAERPKRLIPEPCFSRSFTRRARRAPSVPSAASWPPCPSCRRSPTTLAFCRWGDDRGKCVKRGGQRACESWPLVYDGTDCSYMPKR